MSGSGQERNYRIMFTFKRCEELYQRTGRIYSRCEIYRETVSYNYIPETSSDMISPSVRSSHMKELGPFS